jgi:hypothetical protein
VPRLSAPRLYRRLNKITACRLNKKLKKNRNKENNLFF